MHTSLRNNTSFLILILLFYVGVGSSCQQKFDNQLTSAELEVFGFFLEGKSNETVVIDTSINQVIGTDKPKDLDELFEGINGDTSINFFRINKFQPSIKESFKLASGNSIIGSAEFAKNREKFDGYFVFSRVGFRNDGKQAVVWFSDNSNLIGVEAGFYLLEKDQGIWKIKSESEKVKN